MQSQNANYASFGSGVLIAKASGSNQQSVIFGALQDVTLEISGKTDTLRGQSQFPLAVARSEMDITAKAKIGYIAGPIYTSLYFSGATPTSGTTSLAYGEAHPIPASTPFTVAVTNSATWTTDYGVVYTATGVPLTPVASAPTAGQYSVAAGVYTFAAADTGLAVQISYAYTQTAVGSTIVVPNSLQGVQPVFSVILQRSYNGTGERFLLSNCIAGKLSLPTQMAKFAISEIDFSAFSPNGGSPLTIYTDV